MTDPRNEQRHKRAVIARAAAAFGLVMPGHRFERRALERMAARGEAVPVLGFPNLWRVTR